MREQDNTMIHRRHSLQETEITCSSELLHRTCTKTGGHIEHREAGRERRELEGGWTLIKREGLRKEGEVLEV